MACEPDSVIRTTCQLPQHNTGLHYNFITPNHVRSLLVSFIILQIISVQLLIQSLGVLWRKSSFYIIVDLTVMKEHLDNIITRIIALVWKRGIEYSYARYSRPLGTGGSATPPGILIPPPPGGGGGSMNFK